MYLLEQPPDRCFWHLLLAGVQEKAAQRLDALAPRVIDCLLHLTLCCATQGRTHSSHKRCHGNTHQAPTEQPQLHVIAPGCSGLCVQADSAYAGRWAGGEVRLDGLEGVGAHVAADEGAGGGEAGGGLEVALHEAAVLHKRLQALLEKVLEVGEHLLDALLRAPRPLHTNQTLSISLKIEPLNHFLQESNRRGVVVR